MQIVCRCIKVHKITIGIYKTYTLGGLVLYLLNSKILVQYININHALSKEGYGKVYKYQMLGVENIATDEIFAYQIFTETIIISNMQSCGIKSRAY